LSSLKITETDGITISRLSRNNSGVFAVKFTLEVLAIYVGVAFARGEVFILHGNGYFAAICYQDMIRFEYIIRNKTWKLTNWESGLCK